MDVAAIRLSLIFLLIFYHAFAIYTGGWDVPYEGFPAIPLYYWLGHFSHGFQLEAMVFISGLLFGITISRHPERLNIQGCVIKKMKRILLPSVLFSIVYYWMFYDREAAWYSIFIKIMNGCGHLWFLPMLFWCFVCCYLLERFSFFSFRKVLIIAIFACIFSPGALLPFGLGHLFSFFIYFYLGFALKRSLFSCKLLSEKKCILFIIIYFILICLKRFIADYHTIDLIQKIVSVLLSRMVGILAALSMVISVYSLANMERLKVKLKSIPILVTLSSYCYGVYIYQQFILKYLYYQTSVSVMISPVAIPWLGFIVTLFLSLLFCRFTLKTRFGRFLIG